jgi:uncharacterized protein (DUF58 family)
MSSEVTTEFNDRVQVNTRNLVQLSRYASNLTIHTGRILSRQSGDYQSAFKGRGMEFDESRLYQPGDDIRNIDWRVTARTGKTYTKLFHEERERPVFVWLDLRAPMFFATRGCYKSVMATRLACLLAWSAHHHGDRVGGVIFSDSVHHELKPQRCKSAVLRYIKEIVRHPSWRQSELQNEFDERSGNKAITRLRRIVHPGSTIFLISDFRSLDANALKQISLLSRHNDIVMIYVYDLLEADLPGAGQYRVSDGQVDVILDTYDSDHAHQYHQRHLDHVERMYNLARKNKIRLFQCSTVDDPLKTLKNGLV